MNARTVAAFAIAAAITPITAIPAQAASCTRARVEQTHVLNGQEVHLELRFTECTAVTTIESVAVTSDEPVRVRSLKVYRYTRDGSAGAVRTANMTVPSRAAYAVPLWINRQVPTHRYGYAGFARVTVTASGTTRTVNLMAG